MLIVIPARLESKRFPGKPLALLWGKPLIQWTWEQACQVMGADVVVASGDQDILDTCQSFGAKVFRSVREHATGTSRVAEAACGLRRDRDIVVNWQVDEPFIPALDVADLCYPCGRYFTWPGSVGTLVGGIPKGKQNDPNLVKAACSDGKVHWFTRAPMEGWSAHVGIYVFWASIQYAVKCVTSSLGKAENLEQLAWLENGMVMYCGWLSIPIPPAINVPEDLRQLEANEGLKQSRLTV